MSRYLITFIIFFISSSAFSEHLSDSILLPLSKESAAQLIKLESKGNILSIEEKKLNNKAVFQAKVLHDDGKMKMYLIDPGTGHPPL